MNVINNEIVNYINKKFSSLDLTTNQKAELLAEYLDSPKNFEAIKNDIDLKYEELANSKNDNKFNNKKLDKINGLTAFSGIDLYIKDIKDDSIKTVVDMKDIDDVRNYFKVSAYYIRSYDSLGFAKDGNDYGFRLLIEPGFSVDISPIMFTKDTTYLYESDKENDVCTISRAKVEKKDDYLQKVEENGKEVCRTNKDISFNVISSKHISDVNNVSNDEMIKNSIVRNTYIAKEKYNKEISDDKINKAIERLKDKPANEVDELLKSSLTKKANTKQYGYTYTFSIGWFCAVFGLMVCGIVLLLLVLI